MKVKTSITLSRTVLEEIDQRSEQFHSRSGSLEAAAVGLLRELARKEAEQRDLEIINRRAEALNAEAEDVLDFQVPL